MGIYYLLYSLILVIPHIICRNEKDEIKKRKRIAIWISSTVILMLALRHPSMGIDLGYKNWYGYLPSFKDLSQVSWINILKMKSYLNYEKGYIIYNKIIAIISNDYQCLLAFSALLSLASIGFIFYKLSDDQAFSWIVYLGLPCFLMCYSGLRQAIAIGICIFSFYFVNKKEKIKFILTVLIAMSFHYTACVCFLLYPLFWLKLKKTQRFGAVIIPLSFYIFRVPLFIRLYPLLKDDTIEVEENGAITLFIVFLFIYMFCCFFLKTDDQISGGCLNIFLVACCCQAFGSINMIAQRVGFYFMIPIAISLSNIIDQIEEEKTKLVLKMLIESIFIVYGLYAIMTSTWAMANPYHFFWSSV